MRPFVVELRDTDPLKAFAAIRTLPYSLLFDSADKNHKNSRYSFIACYPVETIESKNGYVTLTNRYQQTTFEADPFAIVQERLQQWNPDPVHLDNIPPFQGGAAGLFGYDLGRTIEHLPSVAVDTPDMPDLAVGIYDQVLAFDHVLNKAWIITQADHQDDAAIKQEFILKIIGKSEEPPACLPAHLKWESNFKEYEYVKTVEKVIEYIKAGDIFQANLSQRFDADLPANFCPFAHYLQLRAVNAAPFASYMNLGSGIVISSASPEQFIAVQDKAVITRPIKGTRARHSDPAIDQLHRNSLENSPKDKAENTMIVDLLRNDLSKVCVADSIDVPELCALESFTSVHHLVSTVKGTLKNNVGAPDLLKVCFPGGSITGAPKIRAMEIIEELEPTRRGPYCGSMAYIGFDGTMDSSILIRTLVYQGHTVSFQTGGGIVYDSIPQDEYEETLHKASAIFESFEPAKTGHDKHRKAG